MRFSPLNTGLERFEGSTARRLSGGGGGGVARLMLLLLHYEREPPKGQSQAPENTCKLQYAHITTAGRVTLWPARPS